MKTVSIILSALISLFCSCYSSAQTTKEQKPVNTFRVISSSGIDVYYTQKNGCTLALDTEDKVDVKVVNDTLILKCKSDALRKIGEHKYTTNSGIKAYISAPSIDAVILSRGADFFAQEISNPSGFSINASGGSDVKCEQIRANNCTLQLSSGSDCEVKQMNVKNLNVIASGGSDLTANVNDATQINIKATGGSDVTLTGKTDSIKVISSGGSDVNVKNLRYQNYF